jgi:proton-dependent oligopeptide transporter, POT family
MSSGQRTATPPPATTPSSLRWPPQIKFIIGNEACERFSYYGIRSILALYISQVLFQHLPAGEAKDRATEIIHLFIFANYFTPLLGAWLSDKLWGRYYTILYVSLIYCLGNLILAIGVGSTWGLYLGLGFIAIGSGGIKPCVSAFCGDQFRPEQSSLLQKAYGLFYWSINFGSFFSFLVIPWLKEEWGYRVAFGVPGLLMLVATIIFWLGRKYYTRMPPSRQTKSAGFFQVIWYALTNLGQRKPGQSMWDVARQRFSEREVDAARSVGPILSVFAPICIFWSLFDQTSSTWVMQGNKMIAFTLGQTGLKIGAEQMQSMNPAFVMMLVPLMLWLYPRVEKLTGVRVSPLRRMGTGLVLAAVSYLIVGALQTRVDAGMQLSVLWQTIPYLILTTGEVLLSTTGLEFAFTQAAAEMKSTIMSFWLLTVAFGNLFVPILTKFKSYLISSAGEGASASVNPSTFYLYAGLTFAVAIIFALIATRYKERKLELTSTQG